MEMNDDEINRRCVEVCKHPSPTLYGGAKVGRQSKWRSLMNRPGVYRKLDYLFWKILCTYPDQTRLGMWWYGLSGRIAGYFHIKWCAQCKGRKEQQK